MSVYTAMASNYNDALSMERHCVDLPYFGVLKSCNHIDERSIGRFYGIDCLSSLNTLLGTGPLPENFAAGEVLQFEEKCGPFLILQSSSVRTEQLKNL